MLKYKNYLHFDNKMSISTAKEYLKNIDNHQYLPFITYKKDKNKWDKNHIKLDESRTISICSHKDRYVYQYYNELISSKYEKFLSNKKYKNCICAYRSKKGKSNIDYAKKALDYIKESDNCRVFIGDISKFFDNLDHKILKNNLKNVLNIDEIDNNMYKMLKSLEKASYIEAEDINEYYKMKGIFIRDNQENIYFSISQYLKNKNQNTIINQKWFKDLKFIYLKPSKEELKNKMKGIVQGAPISGTLSNIYMISIDEEIYNIVSKYNGIYYRYCDDFIIAIKDITKEKFMNLVDEVKNIINLNKLEIKNDKIQLFEYKDKKVINEINNKNFIQFLGFELRSNSNNLYIRQKTLDKQKNKILKDSRQIKKYKDINILFEEEEFGLEKITKVYRQKNYERLKNVKTKNYKKHTFGTYISKSYVKTKSEDIKKLKKDLVNFIDKHIN